VKVDVVDRPKKNYAGVLKTLKGTVKDLKNLDLQTWIVESMKYAYPSQSDAPIYRNNNPTRVASL
jgi:hypothetical protein